MIEAHLSAFDATVMGILALSALVAFFRGFVKEVLSLGAWVGAGLVTIYYFPDAAKWLKPHFKSELVATGFGTLGLYIAALLAFSIFNTVVLRFVKSGSDVGVLDNTFGLAFGLFRGAFIISLGMLLITMVMNKDEYPKWLKEAKTRPFAEEGALMLARIAPEYLQEMTSLRDKLGIKAKKPGDTGEGKTASQFMEDGREKVEEIMKKNADPESHTP